MPLDGGALNAKEKLREKVYEKYEDDDISSLSVELFEKLSVNEIEDAKIISNYYFKEHYGNFDNKKIVNDISEENSKLNGGSLDDFF